ncbi:hypothetical protein ACYPKM_05405 [Pseudomonas aeruginosa]
MSAVTTVVKLLFSASIIALFSGCANLKDIQDLSKETAAITASKDALAYEQGWKEKKDDYNSTFKYFSEKEYKENLASYHREIKRNPNSSITPPVMRNEPQLPNHVPYSDEEVKAVHALQTVLATYMSQISELASDDVIKVDTQVKGLVDNLDKLPVEEDNKDKRDKRNAAYGAILSLLSIPLDAWRQYELKGVIQKNNDDIQLLTSLLAEVTESVGRRISAEASYSYIWYYTLSKAYPSSSFQEAVGGGEAQRIKKDSDLAKGDATIAAAESIRSFGKIHNEMASDLSTFNTKSMKNLLSSVKDAKSKVEKVREQYKEAFGK